MKKTKQAKTETEWSLLVYHYWKTEVVAPMLRAEKDETDREQRPLDMFISLLTPAWAKSLEEQYKRGVADGRRIQSREDGK